MQSLIFTALSFLFYISPASEKKAYVELILKNKKKCNCALTFNNNQKIQFISDTISFNVTKGFYRFNLSCSNGASVNFNVDHAYDTTAFISMKFDIESLKKK